MNVNSRFVVSTLTERHHKPMVHTDEQHDGDRLRALMARAKVSQATLARALDLSPTAVGKWFRAGQISRSQIAPICRLLRCSADELLGLVPIAPAAAIAEARATYSVMRPDVKTLIEKYEAASPDGKETLQRVGAAVAQPALEHLDGDHAVA